MVKIWEWNGTIEQIQALTYPEGYTMKKGQIYAADIAGFVCLRLEALKRASGAGGNDAPTISAYVKDVMEYWVKRSIFIPVESSHVRTDGGHGWFNQGASLQFMYEQAPENWQPWGSGHIGLSEHPSDQSKGLRIQAYWKKSGEPFGDTQVSGYLKDAEGYLIYVPKGQWVEQIDHVIIDRFNGVHEHFINGNRIIRLENICTDPHDFGKEIGTNRVNWRHYTDNELNFPQSIYYKDLVVQTEPFDVVPPEIFTCAICGATFSTQAELDQHMQDEHEIPPEIFTCAICGATFSTQAELDQHMQDEHPTPVQMGATPFLLLIFAIILLLLMISSISGKKKIGGGEKQ